MLLIVQNYHLVLWDSNLFFEVVQEENKTVENKAMNKNNLYVYIKNIDYVRIFNCDLRLR